MDNRKTDCVHLLLQHFPGCKLCLRPRRPIAEFFVGAVFFHPFRQMIGIGNIQLLSVFLLHVHRIPLLSVIAFMPDPVS